MPVECSLQINLAPNDYRHAALLLRHQLETLAAQVTEVVLVLDTHRSKGRFGHNWSENLLHIRRLIHDICEQYPKVRFAEVDYSDSTRRKVAACFFGNRYIPRKDYRGGPFYAYFYGLYISRYNFVFHLDSDMFLGGTSNTWIDEALSLFDQNNDMLVCSPLPGPPHPGNLLRNQPDARATGPYTFEFSGMSTRIFMINKHFFEHHKLRLTVPSGANILRAGIKGNPPYSLPEQLLSAYMRRQGLKRIDFLGTGKGLWSLHPPYRNRCFFENLPALIRQIEDGDVPMAQRGFYDIDDSMVNWEDARLLIKNSAFLKRLPKYFRTSQNGQK